MLNENTQNINTTLNNLPNVVENFGEVGENMKDVTEVVTEVTADFLVTKDSVKSNMDVIVDILTIIKNIFLDKK
ncbi:putative lipoprotein [Clostridioides difficile CD69]|nr:putative lipoprotein [Clostridioides difficile CD69]